jgi:hypothetical protein
VQELFGKGLSNALNAAYQQYQTNLATAASLAQGNAKQYGAQATEAGTAASSGAGNLGTSITGALGAASKLFPSGVPLSPSSTPSSPTGSSSSATIFNPASASGAGNQPAPGGSGFDTDTPDPGISYA